MFWSSGDEKLGSDVAGKNQKDMTNISQPYHHITISIWVIGRHDED